MPRKSRKTKQQTLPDKYEPGFLTKLDGRTEVARLLRDNYTAVADDLGGQSELSHVKSALVERFVFLEATLNKIEADLATEPEKSSELMGRWIQAVNSLTGLAKVLGIERKMSTRPWLAAPESNGNDA